MTSSVFSSGTLKYVDTVAVGFPQGGKLVALKVKVGDHVTVGQQLAQVEDLEQRVSLRKAQASVRIEEARLAKLIANNGVENADDEEGYAGQSLDAQNDIREETIEQDHSEINQLGKKLDFDRRQLQRQQAKLLQDRQCEVNDGNPLNGEEPTDDCIDRINAREDAVEAAKRDILNRKSDIKAAQNKLDVDRANQHNSVISSERAQESAKNSLDKARSERPFDIQVQRQILEQARADMELSQRNLDKTIKPSAYSGTVDGIHGRVGQVMTAAFGEPTDVKGATADSPAGDKLITLKDVNAYQLVVPFQPADGQRISPEQPVEVTFPDRPGLVSPARIAAIEPPVPGQNASYVVTVVLKEVAPDLKADMPARVGVAVNKIDNTLSVPSSAVRVNGRAGTVGLVAADGTVRETPVELGMIGDRMIQILAGVKPDDKVRSVHPD